MNNYCWKDDLMNLCRLLFAATIVLTFPLECFVCRDVVQHILTVNLKLLSQEASQVKTTSLWFVQWLTTFFQTLLAWISVTAAITLIALVISFTTQCLGIVMALNVRQSQEYSLCTCYIVRYFFNFHFLRAFSWLCPWHIFCLVYVIAK